MLPRLPALAFNTNERDVVAAYPEALPIERRALREFVAAFLSKKLRTKADSDAFALQKVDDVKAPTFEAKRNAQGHTTRGLPLSPSNSYVFELDQSEQNNASTPSNQDLLEERW